MTRRTTCRHLTPESTQCTAEAIDPNADILICARHAALVIHLIRTRTANLSLLATR